jgi:hypothetical protein
MIESRLIAYITIFSLIVASYIRGIKNMSGTTELQTPDPREQNTLALFNAIYGNIQFIKRQQWQLVYYSLLLQGALVFIRTKSTIPPCVFVALTWAISIFSYILLCNFVGNLRKERKVIAPLRTLCFMPRVFDILYLAYPEKLTPEKLTIKMDAEANKKDGLYLAIFFLLFLCTSITVTFFAYKCNILAFAKC